MASYGERFTLGDPKPELALSNKACYNTFSTHQQGGIVPKQLLYKISIYVPKGKLEQRPVERLIALADEKDRSVNYLVVEAILEYLTREEKKKA